MAEPFKNMLDENVIRGMSTHIKEANPAFDSAGFVAFAVAGLVDLELKQRSNQITEALEQFLPEDFKAATDILLASLEPRTDLGVTEVSDPGTNGIAGWPVMPMADYVASRGQDDVDVSLSVLREMTMRSSSEFAIRAFLANHQEQTLQTLQQWCNDPNEHVRRLVSEGSRPRLPWGARLTSFVDDPAPVVALLEELKDDPSEYVRRSVANNLNDIAKDHPDLVSTLTARWMQDAGPERTKLVRHALRTLVKQGHRGALSTLGYKPAQLVVDRFEVLTPEVTFGGALEFELDVKSTDKLDQPLMIDYTIHHMKANGATTPKVFKWKTTTLLAGASLGASRRHAMKPITTRRYYPGVHKVEIGINGDLLVAAPFNLLMTAEEL